MQPRNASWIYIWNMSFGFFGIQFGWGLQMANMSAIYQYLGADESSIPWLWLAAPVTGLIVQPIVGYYSDRTWCRLGRRRPFFLVGAILASLALIAMPNSPTLWMAAGLLWILDASINITMEPFRAFVGDLLPPKQRKTGFAMQSLLIGAGAVLSSAMPWILTNIFSVESSGDGIPLTVKLSFYAGAALFFSAVLYTILTTREHPPEDMEAFLAMKKASRGLKHVVLEIIQGIRSMPFTMRRLAWVQFFTWFALFCMWIYFVPAVAKNIFGGMPDSEEYRRGIEWGGVCFATYNGVAFGFAFILLGLVRYFSAKWIHMLALIIGAIGFLSIPFASTKEALLPGMVAIGIAWASILSMPYALLANGIPSAKMGFYMGVFNFFLVLPQILAAVALGPLMRHFLGNNAMYALFIGGCSLVLATLAMIRVPDKG